MIPALLWIEFECAPLSIFTAVFILIFIHRTTKSRIKISSLYVLCVCVCRAFHSHFALAKCAWFYYFVHIVYLWSTLWVTVTCLPAVHAVCVCVFVCVQRNAPRSRASFVSCIAFDIAWLIFFGLMVFFFLSLKTFIKHTHTANSYVCIACIQSQEQYASKQCKIKMIAAEWWMVWPPRKKGSDNEKNRMSSIQSKLNEEKCEQTS